MAPERLLQPLAQHPSLQERTYRTLRDAIVQGEFAPGSRIYETAIAERLGVSRVPVREAIRRLQQDGFVDARPRTGIYVAAFGINEVTDLYRIRAALEGTAASLAAERMSDEEISELEAVLHRMESATARRAKRATFHEADLFHKAIHHGARSPRLFALLEQLYGQVAHYRKITLAIPGRADDASHGHHDLVEAIHRRDSETADRLMRTHVLGAVAALVQHTDGASTPTKSATEASTSR
jgi:DNA-binding GntR family transcriptional regulator